MASSSPVVVIVGGGIAGVTCAQEVNTITFYYQPTTLQSPLHSYIPYAYTYNTPTHSRPPLTRTPTYTLSPHTHPHPHPHTHTHTHTQLSRLNPSSKIILVSSSPLIKAAINFVKVLD